MVTDQNQARVVNQHSLVLPVLNATVLREMREANMRLIANNKKPIDLWWNGDSQTKQVLAAKPTQKQLWQLLPGNNAIQEYKKVFLEALDKTWVNDLTYFVANEKTHSLFM